MEDSTQSTANPNQLQKFDPSKLMDGVRDRIKATFVSLIPDDAWDSMVEKEIYIFTQGHINVNHETDWKTTTPDGRHPIISTETRVPYSQKPLRDQWNRETGKDDISPLQEMIREELRKKFRDDLLKYLNSDKYQAFFDSEGMTKVSEAIEDIVVKNSGTIFQNIIAQFIQAGFNEMRRQISYQQQGNY